MSREAPPPPSQVGRYVVLRPLGQGGMGVVYAAYDPDLDRKVALKLLRQKEGADEELARARLLREAQAMARHLHPNVIPVFDMGLWGAQVFLAMELIDGDTLQHWVEAEKRPWRQVVEAFLSAGEGLVAAHEAGLVHRDFKPSNVLVSRAGRICVTDFGLARQQGEGGVDAEATLPAEGPVNRMLSETLTASNMVMGTPYFMAPEQLRGLADARSDQFSFCVSLYWALYRRRPFREGDFSAVLATPNQGGTAALESPRNRAPELPREGGVPAWVRQALGRGLALDPAARFPSMRELLQALSHERRRARARRVAAIAAGVVAVAALGGGAVVQRARACANAASAMAESWSPEARERVRASLTGAGTAFGADVAPRVEDALDRYAEAWGRQRVEVCEAARGGTLVEALAARREGCLERRRRDLAAVAGLLSHADAKLVEKAVDAVHALPSLRECADAASLAEIQGLPEDAARRAEIERLAGELAEVKALLDAGRIKPALDRAEQAGKSVEATGHAPLIAEWRLRRGVAEDQLGNAEVAARELTRAALDAEAGHADRLKIGALVKLLVVDGKLGRFDAADDWGGLAEAALKRIGGDAELEGDLRVNQAVAETARLRLDVAQRRLQQAEALQAALPPGHPKRARMVFQAGNLAWQRGDQARAVELLLSALDLTQAAVGPWHPDMARRHGLLSVVLREKGDPAGALPHARAAVEIRSKVLGPDAEPTAEAMDEQGQCLLALGRWGEALEVYRRALEIKRKTLPEGDQELQYSWDGVGQALLGMGKAREAVEPLRQAVSIATAEPEALAESGFALAKALVADRRRPEALAEAIRAQARFREAKRAERAAEVAAWRAGLERH